MASLASSLVVPVSFDSRLSERASGGVLKTHKKNFAFLKPSSLPSVSVHHPRTNVASFKTRTILCSGLREDGGSSSAGIFIGGFILGGVIVGTLGCVFAPQISKALAGADRKDLMRRLPKFIYDEEKALEKTRKVLADKIAQLNAAIDEVSSQLRVDDPAVDGAAVVPNEVEAAS